MNWGYGIMTVIILFMGGIIGMVVLSTQQTIDMMDDKYYERELKHQSLIEHSERFIKTNGQINLIDRGDLIELVLPENVSNAVTSGTIDLLRTNDKKLDRSYELKPVNGRQIFKKTDFTNGVYNVRLAWVNDGQSYYQTFVYNLE